MGQEKQSLPLRNQLRRQFQVDQIGGNKALLND
jgi:hypothetical protein